MLLKPQFNNNIISLNIHLITTSSIVDYALNEITIYLLLNIIFTTFAYNQDNDSNDRDNELGVIDKVKSLLLSNIIILITNTADVFREVLAVS